MASLVSIWMGFLVVMAIAKDDIRQVLAETLNEMTVTVSPKINCFALVVWCSPLLL